MLQKFGTLLVGQVHHDQLGFDGSWLVGPAERVIDAFGHLQETYPGLDEIMVAQPVGAQPGEIFDQMGRFAAEVMPASRLTIDGDNIDRLRASGRTHTFARWPGTTAAFARHLMTRALTPTFPQIVADHADVIAPLHGGN